MKAGDLLSVSQFMKRFFFHMRYVKTQEEAYFITEGEYRDLYRKNKYSSYQSFRIVKNRHIKNI